MTYKGYKVALQPGTAMLRITNKGPGPAPVSLRGLYTSQGDVVRAIDSHEREVEARIKKNAPKSRRSTD